jgi:DUF971 family protein
MKPAPFPVALEPNTQPATSAKKLVIRWSDGAQAEIPYFELRFECPCAGCVNEITGERMLRRETLPQDVRPAAIEPVGRYAVRVRWTDGHETGMYSFERLRELSLPTLGQPHLVQS